MKTILAALLILGLAAAVHANPLQSPTRRGEDNAHRRGRERREALERGDTPRSLEGEEYRDLTDAEKDAYKAGYRGETQKRRR